ncbi:MAG: methyltransferase domain-containing protein [Dehalococcoidia bacterium]
MTAWDPALYARFEAERSQPFYDLASLVRRSPGMSVLDLGCGSGELTAWLHRRLEAASTLGIDSSTTMLERAAGQSAQGLAFEAGDIDRFDEEPWGQRRYDLVFSNAALQWVPDHERLLPRLRSLVATGGQIAVQMPANEGHVSHVTAMELAREEPYASALDGYERPLTVLSPVRYAELLHELGFEEQSVRLQIYPHLLPGPESVVEWVSGTFLTAFRSRLSAELYGQFLAEYGRRLLGALGPRRPYLYTYPRVLIWGRLPE